MAERVNRDQDGASRREVLAGLASAATVAATVAALPSAAAAAPAAGMPDGFLLASSKLCGLPLDKSYSQLGEAIWKALGAERDRVFLEVCRIAADAPNEAALRRRLVDNDAYWARTKALVLAWYTGMVPEGGIAPDGAINPDARVVTYDEALAWTACGDFTKPSATCGGPFGYWHEPPADLPAPHRPPACKLPA